MLTSIHVCHLPIDAEESSIVAVGAEGIGTGDGILPGDEGEGRLVEVAVGAAQEVAREETVVGRAVTVEIVDGTAQQGVARDRLIGQVLTPGLGQSLTVLRFLTPCAGGEEKEGKDDVREEGNTSVRDKKVVQKVGNLRLFLYLCK